MIDLFGGTYSAGELRDRVADISTLIGVKPHTLFDGPERGVFSIDVWAGDFRFTVVPDRGMDICRASSAGVPLDWSSGTGVTSPFLYNPNGWRWLSSFHGGLVHTCGLDNVGEPVEGESESYGGHGRISNTSARDLSWGVDEIDDQLVAHVAGTVRSISALEENIELRRRITTALGSRSVRVEDTIRNLGSSPTPLFLLYHCNFGFPILSEDSQLSIPARSAIDASGNEIKDIGLVSGPVDEIEESVIHPIIEGDDEEISIRLFNPRLRGGMGIYLAYRRSELPHLTIWKFFQTRANVLAIEPGTCRVAGRTEETKHGRAITLEKDEQITTHIEIGVEER